MPDSPNLLFTNAGMNQFVPIFLGERKPDVDKWAGAILGPGTVPTRAADTQKCIRAGGKHNDLEDVGLDTYHHTFFEMLGNWSFGDYFKKEAIDWAWELVTDVWKFPTNRLYATVFCPDGQQHLWKDELTNISALAYKRLQGANVAVGGPSTPVLGEGIENQDALGMMDTEAALFWACHFLKDGLDPREHIVPGNKKDNFWMMGETGPCGPCSELHMDLTPTGDTRGALVNKGTAECIEIWNLVFIQFNANPDGTFSPLPAKHVDTGMGFERVTSIIQGTKGFTDFVNAKISNYETDIFRPIFDEIEKLSGKKYTSTLPSSGSAGANEQEKIDVAFRVIADHIRTLSFAIADGIQPGNTDRNYVLRRILRRAVKYGRTLGFHEPFFYKLVDVLARTMGDVFPEIRAKQKHVKDVLKLEEEAFNKTLDRGISEFNAQAAVAMADCLDFPGIDYTTAAARRFELGKSIFTQSFDQFVKNAKTLYPDSSLKSAPVVSGAFAFRLYDEQGFPLDLTELMARERGLTVDVAGFNALMEEQKARARAAQKKQVIELSQIETTTPTKFLGYDSLETNATVLEIVELKEKTAIVLDTSACYAEMGGQVGDTGELAGSGHLWQIFNTQKSGNTFLHFLDGGDAPAVGSAVTLSVNRSRRHAIERHHTVTHLLHWALHEVVNREASQKGSFVGPDKLTFDFNNAPLTPQQVADVEKLVNERILENAGVSWTEVPYTDVRSRPDIMQFFGDKYGDRVRVVQIGGHAQKLDGYSMELCGGTHTRATGEIGLFRIVGESAIAAGVRRIEAVAGLEAYQVANHELELIKSIAGKINSPIGELEKKIESLLAHQKELEKALKAAKQREAAQSAKSLVASAESVNDIQLIARNMGEADGDTLQTIADALKGEFKGVIVLGGVNNSAVSLVAAVHPELTKKVQAGKLIQGIAPIVGGKGGGRPDNARGGGKDASKLDEALAKVKSLLG